MSSETKPPQLATPSLETLQNRLDVLWEQHLRLLDRYDMAQKRIRECFSSGFFSLAQATFKSPTKIRYGRDYYDERMRASRRVGVVGDGEEEEVVVKVSIRSEQTTTRDEKTAKEEAEEGKEKVEQLRTPPATPLHHADDDSEAETRDAEPLGEKTARNNTKEDEKDAVDKAKANTSEQADEAKAKKPRDPVNWYGILVPSQLRQSQASFLQAVEGPVGEAVSAAQGMRKIEVEIRRLRKDIKKAEKKSLVVEDHP